MITLYRDNKNNGFIARFMVFKRSTIGFYKINNLRQNTEFYKIDKNNEQKTIVALKNKLKTQNKNINITGSKYCMK